MSSEKLRRANEQLQRLQAELTTERETAAAAEQAKVGSSCGFPSARS